MVGPVHEELDEAVVFQDCQAGFPLAPVDQDLTLQIMADLSCGTRGATARPAPACRSTLG
jgi:hypothetical protein